MSVGGHVSDYSVVDLETTGVFVSAARIIEISALKVRNDEIVDEYSVLVNPECHIPEDATAVNHITDDMVADAPVITEVIDGFLDFVGDDPILGYNNAGFDMNILYDNVMRIKTKPFSNDYIDLLHTARRALPDMVNHKLETLSKYYQLDTTGEHRALADCRLTKLCYDRIYEEYGDVPFRRKSGAPGARFTPETIALQELKSTLASVLDDGVIDDEEVDDLRFWVEEHRDLAGHYPFDRVFSALDIVLEDGVVTEEEKKDMVDIFAEVIDPVKCNSCHTVITVIQGKHICLTGDFAYGPKDAVMALIEEAGGINDKGVKKATDFLVVGNKGSESWKAGNYGGKVLKAMELNKKGQNILIVEEDDFIAALSGCVENPAQEDMQITLLDFDEESWMTIVRSTLDDIMTEQKLPAKSLRMEENYGRDAKTITSYSITINEPNMPMLDEPVYDSNGRSNALNLRPAGDALELLVNISRFDLFALPADATVKELKSDKINKHVFIPVTSEGLSDYIRQNIEYALANYTSKAGSFSCCSHYEECSDNKCCIQKNKLFSKACSYRKNLEAGRIFYGKNKNV